jgi:hypothetical protein
VNVFQPICSVCHQPVVSAVWEKDGVKSRLWHLDAVQEPWEDVMSREKLTAQFPRFDPVLEPCGHQAALLVRARASR